jgi:arylsulfatase A-like enzyme
MCLKQNLILLTIDCLRADGVGCLGGPSDITPNIDRLARAGALFSQAITNGPGTPESFPSIMTSTYALMNPNSGAAIPNNTWVNLADKWPTIAEILHSRGFSTAAVNANPYLTSYSNYNRGFDFFDDSLSWYKSNRVIQKLKEMGTLFGNKFLRADEVHQKAISWLKESCYDSKRFFLWLHYMDAHAVYNPKGISFLKHIEAMRLERKMSRNPKMFSKEELDKFIGYYHQEIKYTDREIGIFLDKLESMGISLENTFFVVTADHGEQFLEHGKWGHGRLYDEVLHVPLIVSGPGIEPHTHIKDQVTLLDLSPTMLDLLAVSKCDRFLGESLFPMIKGRNKKRQTTHVISERVDQNFSCRTSNWKYITDLEMRNELYDLQNDPHEKQNVASQNPKKVKELGAIIEKHVLMEKQANPLKSEKQSLLSAENKDVLKERLKSLGYF